MKLVRTLACSFAAIACAGACTFVQLLENSEGSAPRDAQVSVDAGTDGPLAVDAADADVKRAVCTDKASGAAQDTPLGSVLVVGWERLDGRFFVERGRASFSGERRSFTVSTGASGPPADARISASASSWAIGHVYAVAPTSTLEGLVEGNVFRAAMAAGTYRDALVFTDETRPLDAGATWIGRAQPGYTVWRCTAQADKSQAFSESTCDALVLESAGDPTGDRHCDWH
jgi:hypothetical protein